jgi:hypothetical protein
MPWNFEPCPHCAWFILHHARWCRERNDFMFYVFNIVEHPEMMTDFDKCTLRGLGVIWY